MTDKGELLIALPAEGGFMYGLGRQLTSKPYMEKKYGIDYMAVVKNEHWNLCSEVIELVDNNFVIVEKKFIPFSFLPTGHCNVVVCLRAKRV